MTEADWWDCVDPADIFYPIREGFRFPERKLRLFAVGCCRRVAHWFSDPALEAALAVAERFADLRASEAELVEADRAVVAVERELEQEGTGHPESAVADDAFFHAVRAVGQTVCLDDPECPFAHRMVDTVVHVACAAAFAAVAAPWEGTVLDRHASWGRAEDAERAALAGLARDVLGNPFRPAAVDPVCLTTTVRRLAQAAYEERRLPAGTLDAGRLAVLADALEEAGCTDAAVLGHLRSPGPHVRGCWAVDLLLGKG